MMNEACSYIKVVVYNKCPSHRAVVIKTVSKNKYKRQVDVRKTFTINISGCAFVKFLKWIQKCKTGKIPIGFTIVNT